MDKKYEFIERVEDQGGKYFRIRALKSFGNIQAGDIGGLVSSVNSLSQFGLCWVGENAKISGTARVLGDAQVTDYAIISAQSIIMDNVRIAGNASIGGKTTIMNDVDISGEVIVGGKTHISGNAIIHGRTFVMGCTISGHPQILGPTRTSSGSILISDSEISGNSLIECDLGYSEIRHSTIEEYAKIIGTVLVTGESLIYGECTLFNGEFNEFRQSMGVMSQQPQEVIFMDRIVRNEQCYIFVKIIHKHKVTYQMALSKYTSSDSIQNTYLKYLFGQPEIPSI